MSRLAEIPLAEMSDAQRRVHDDIVSGPRGAVMKGFPPLFQPWLRSPGLADPAQRLGAFVRLESSLPPRLSELAILITARCWECAYEWSSHQRFAREAGITEDTIAAIADRRRPEFDSDDQAAVHDFCLELHRDHAVAEDTYQAAAAHLGEQGLVELVGLLGYYTLAAMTLIAFEMGDAPVPPWAESGGTRRAGGC